MNEFSALLENATRKIPHQYFELPIVGGDYVYRERVYCYELYHQLRTIWPNSAFSLNGELDKAAHPLFRSLQIRQKPDFLVYVPGSMENNEIVMEVKTAGAGDDGIRKDFETIQKFILDVGYKRGVFLMFGSQVETQVPKIRRVFASLENLSNIEVWLHSSPGHPAFRLIW